MYRSDLEEVGEMLNESDAASLGAGDDRADQAADEEGGKGGSEGNRV